MIKVVRTRGLAPRHWRQIGNTLGIVIDINNTNLFKLIVAEFHEPKILKQVKTITDIAAKEYAV